ncbi:glycoside hydrolase family 97 catalytic domain-containing protein [Candidatus Sumerlaeota bacterium]|nr:glycoside hydrolase family 97 catalytic domain-containing protein [Candidatus Sumerlaeota bacterium]
MSINPIKPLITCTTVILCSCSASGILKQNASGIASPDGRLTVDFLLTADGAPRYAVMFDGRPVLQESRLGLVRDDADFSKGLRLVAQSEAQLAQDHYEILTAKRRVNDYQANRKEFHLETADGQKMNIIFQVADDGVAFRYFFPETDAQTRRLTKEVTSFHFLPEAKAWMQPMSVAKTGWAETHPSYEEFYEKEIPAGTPSPSPAGWVYPALFRSGDDWLLLSECALGRNYCATRLRAESPDGEYSIGFPDPREHFQDGPVNPESPLPWFSPWRIIVAGNLKTIAESMLGVDLADKPEHPATDAIEPGKASWSWPLLGDGSAVFNVQKEFIDYAAEMNWRHCLIDAQWDQQIGYDKMKELADYGRTKNVKIHVWYNSAGDWNKTYQTPRGKLLTHESRVKEFDRLKEIGIAGLKIDFFGGDGQSVINYYQDILDDAEPYGFLINFHGSTLPRGWQRTYPHLMTMEGIKGLEFITFDQGNADQEPTHACMLPFTRNVFDPMDFTPMVLDHLPNTQRRTTSAFELALSVLFTSGIQHYAEIPRGMAKTPDYVREFLKGVPSVWDDIKFIDGYPGKHVVIARQGEDRWYIAGINGESAEKKLTLDLSDMPISGTGSLITDGDGGNLSFRREDVQLAAEKKIEVTLKPCGGFVMVLE